MKQRDIITRKVVGEWLRKAEADFELADHLLTERASFRNAVVFNSQQSSESNTRQVKIQDLTLILIFS